MNSDVIIVGSGINSLTCGALLAKSGRRVTILERNDRPGGCIRSDTLTLPGFTHDVLSGFYPQFIASPTYAELGPELHARGLSFCNNDTPTGAILPDGRAAVLYQSRERNVAALNETAAGDGDRYAQDLNRFAAELPLVLGLLGREPWRWSTLALLLKEAMRKGPLALSAFFGESLGSCRSWLTSSFESELNRALLAPWVLHAGLGPDAPLSGFMGKLFTFGLEAGGMPVVKGGSAEIVRIICDYIRDKGGSVICGADVNEILVNAGKTHGVRTADGREFTAKQAVVCNVTPTQLYGRLAAAHVSADVKRQAQNYRYGRGDMQIHLALNEAPQWTDPRLNSVAMIHVTPGLDAISRAVAEAECGYLPSEATIVVAQPTALDPSRAPDGKAILWIQLQELPARIKGDSAGVIPAPADGKWTPEIKERYADRIIERLCRHIPNLRQNILGRAVLSPADLEALNINLVGGDPYSGDCGVDQFLLWRPLKATRNHSTPIKRLYHIGASTHPGPGLGGASGYMVAKELGA